MNHKYCHVYVSVCTIRIWHGEKDPALRRFTHIRQKPVMNLLCFSNLPGWCLRHHQVCSEPSWRQRQNHAGRWEGDRSLLVSQRPVSLGGLGLGRLGMGWDGMTPRILWFDEFDVLVSLNLGDVFGKNAAHFWISHDVSPHDFHILLLANPLWLIRCCLKYPQ